jgi:ADP-heptose:LPS heptosyltransferase
LSRKFLLVQLQHMGDVVLATPAARAVRAAEPGAVIHFLAGAAGAHALRGNPHIDRVVEHRTGFRAFAAQVRALRRERYDVVVDFHSVPRTALMVAATAAPLRIGVRGRGPRNAAYTRLVPRERDAVYMPRQKLRLLEEAGIDATTAADPRPYVHVAEADGAWAEQFRQRLDPGPGRPVAAVSAVSKLRHKQWGAARWAAVADGLAAQGVAVILTHGPGEADQAGAVRAAMREPAVIAGVDTVARLAALFQRCDLWLGNDGGPKHIAAAVGTPTIAVARWGVGPVWNDAADARQRWFDSAPPTGCDRRCDDCPHLGCLAATTPDDVLAAAAALLRQAR